MSEREIVTYGPALCAALVLAQKNAEAVAKKVKNEFHKYNYAAAEAVIGVANEALAEAGLAAFPIDVGTDPAATEHEWKPIEYADKGVACKDWRITKNRRLQITLLVVHGESGEHVVCKSSVPVCPEKGRPEDKSEFGARTEGLAYALRDLLLLQRLAETDISGRDDTDGDAPPAQPRAFSVAPKGAAAERPKEKTTSAPGATTSTTAPASAAKTVDSVIQGPKGQTEMPSASAVAAPSPATGDSANAPAAGAVSPAFAAKLAAESEFNRDKYLTDVRNCAKNELKWDLPKCVLVISKLFGINKLQDLTDPQLTDLRAIMFAGAADGEDAYHAEIASRYAANPGRYQKGAAK